jgi:NADH-quinone oxidoreductase subunit D
MFKGAVMDDPIIHYRTKGIGVLTKQQAIDYCVLGPTARASGIPIDVRKDEPYAAYDRVNWDIVVQQEGDVFAKAVVRIIEMYESVSIIQQCLDKMPKGEIDAKVTEIPPGEGLGHHEAPRGEVFHYTRSDGTNRPARYKVRAPSFMNLPSNKIAAVGQTISDAAITLAAIDPCYCCTERMAAVDEKGKTIYTAQDLIRLSQEKTEKLRAKYRK